MTTRVIIDGHGFCGRIWRAPAALAAALVLPMACAPGASPVIEPPARTEQASPGAQPVILLGELDTEQILGVSPEWKQGYAGYVPDADSLEAVRAASRSMKGELRIEAVIGTWCGDSRRDVPRFLKLQSRLDADRLPARIWGVDRSKQNPPGGTEGRGIERVPTFIVYRGDLEIGRIIEKPAVSVEADLAEILGRAEKR